MQLRNTIHSISILIFLVILTSSEVFAFPNQEGNNEPIKIGFLISTNNSVEARYAAEMAVQEANKKSGKNGPKFELITRSMEGPWGTGSKETVNLVFNEKVWAIVGSHDGRNAHLVEQVIAKTHIVFISAWATDPTLSQAFVPWYFSNVPNNNQQASLFCNEIYNRQKLKKVVTLSDNEYDSEMALKCFLNEIKATNNPDPTQLFYDIRNPDCSNLVNQIIETNCEAVVLFGKPAASVELIKKMRQEKMKQQVFGALSVVGEDSKNHFKLTDYEDVVLLNTGFWLNPDGIVFSKKFKNKYGWIPGAVAAYAYDGINLAVEAIKKSGFNRELVKQTMFDLHYEGVTGNVRFDKNGNRSELNGVVIIKNGIPVPIKK